MTDNPILPVQRVEEEPAQRESEAPMQMEDPARPAATPEQPHDAVLLLAHGTPDVLGEMAEYLSKVTGGRALPQEVVQELQHRYGEIGLKETPGEEAPPLTKWTLTQGFLLEQALNYAGPNTKVYVGMRNWHPYISDVVAQMRADGVKRFKAVCLAPQNSRTSVGLYRKAVAAAAEGMEMTFVAGWAENPTLARAFADRLWPAWAEACAITGRKVPVLFTAHSVPLPDDYDRSGVGGRSKARDAGTGITGPLPG